MKIITERTVIELLEPNSAKLILDYHIQNKEHLAPWEPLRNDEFFTIENWEKTLQTNLEMFEAGTAIKLAALNYDRNEVIAVCNFSNIIHGVFQACSLGYSISHKYQGQGIMQEVILSCLDYVFNEVGLHRVMANYVPTNLRSEKVLMKLGFEQEGVAKSYLKIAGKWQDHILTSKINPNH